MIEKTTGNDKKPPRRKGALRQKLYLVLFGVLFGLLLCEIFLRVIGYSYPIFYVTDRDRGFALRPGIEGYYQREGESYVRINSDGQRDREHAKTKPADTVRIAVLGDSFAEAMHVPMEQTFWWLLGRKLEECNAFPGKHVEVLNFGVSGYGTAQELLTLRQKVWDYSPDVVMLAFTTGNDVCDNSRALSQAKEIPYFVYRDGKLVSDDSFRDSSKFQWRDSSLSKFGGWLRNRLRVVQLIDYASLVVRLRLNDWRERRRAVAVTKVQTGTAKAQDFSIDKVTYLEPKDENWKDAWQVTEGLITQISNEVRLKGARFLMVAVSNDIQVYPDSAVRQSFLQRVGADTLFYPNQRLTSLATREQIDFLDLAEPMQVYADQNKIFLHGFGKDLGNGHWNADGHRVAADLITQKLCHSK